MTMIRTNDQKEKIISRFTDAYVVDNFLTKSEITALIKLFNSEKDKIYKNTGPVTCSITDKDLFNSLMSKVTAEVGDCRCFASLFFYVETPHIVHNDDLFTFPSLYKAFTLPLEINYIAENTGYPSLCIFEQYYLNGPSKFFKGSKDVPTYYNKQVYDYSDVQNLKYTGIDRSIKQDYLSHLKDSWLDGLTIHKILPWKPGSAIVFNSAQLHCASNFKHQGIRSKLGISIFTEKD